MTANARYRLAEDPLVVGRAASLPSRVAVELLEAPNPLEAARAFFARNAFARTAVYVASADLGEALERWVAGDRTHSGRVALRALSYALRMASRCTPFGLFAGVGTVNVAGDGRPLELDESSPLYRTHTRPDMELVERVARAAEAGPTRRRLRYVTNDCAFVRGERLYVMDGDRRDVSLKHTKAVAFLRRRCERAGRYDRIVADLREEFGADEDECRRLLDRLIDAGVLLCELRPSPVGSPVAAVTEALRCAGAPEAQSLCDAIEAVRTFDAIAMHRHSPQDVQAMRAVLQRAAPQDPPRNLAQVDLRAVFRGTLPPSIAEDVALAAELSVRCGRVVRLKRYRERFIERYEGTERLVPLLELVDNQLGLGVPEDPDLEEDDDAARRVALFQVLAEAARDGVTEIDLSTRDLDVVLPRLPGAQLPRAIEVGFHIAARSAAGVARGEYRFITTLLAERPLATMARFAAMLGDDAVAKARRTAAQTVAADELVAELCYAPPTARAYNVMTRPPIYSTEVRAGIGIPAPDGDSISPADLWVGLDLDGFYLWSAKRQRRVTVRETHAFVTTLSSPGVCRFLSLLQRDGVRLAEFHLGSAEQSTYVPRLSYGRIVLRPQRWRFARERLLNDLRGMRDEWGMPRYVALSQADNRLLLDLDAAVTGDLLRAHSADESIEIEELLPAPSDVWVSGAGGSHAVEFVAQALAAEPAALEARAATAPILVEPRPRYGPQSAWVYAKFYISDQATDDFLVSRIAPMVAELRDRIERWFFVRYADPMPHVRLRLRGHDGSCANALRERVSSQAERWLAEGTIDRYALDTYDPEYERYGGVDGMVRAERFFTVSSEVSLAILAEGHAETSARIEAAAASLDACVDGSEALRDAAIEAFSSNRSRTLEARDRESLRRILATAPAAAELRQLLDDAVAGDPVPRLRSIVHMHCNRLGLRDGAEQRAGLLLRAAVVARDSIRKSGAATRATARARDYSLPAAASKPD